MSKRRKKVDTRGTTKGMPVVPKGPTRGTPVTSNKQLLDYIAERLPVDVHS